MNSALLTDRPASGTWSGSAAPWQNAGTTAAPGTANWCVLPRCKIEFEKCSGGFKIHCSCDDDVACGTLQNLCRMVSDGLCNCCVTWNGIQLCQCNLAVGLCRCEYTKDGCTISCTSGDKKCCEVLQACCDCLSCCCEAGGCCYVSFGNTPVCCGKC